ncbi:MAG: trimethylamine methyltransferase family protein [Chloroflexota bacterium]
MALKVASRPLSVISEEHVEIIHQASLRILEEVGVEVLHDGALDLLARAGAEVDRARKRARLPRQLVLDALERAPSSFTLHARNRARDVQVGGDSVVLVPVGGPAMVEDLEGGRRVGTFADQVNFIKLSQRSRLLDMAYRCVEAQDLPPSTRHLDYLYALLRYTDKPLATMTLDTTSARDSLAIASLVFGDEEYVRTHPVILGGVNIDSPLRFLPDTVETIIAFAGSGQPLKITPFVMAGVMSPATLAGALAQENAESLACIVLAETINPGTPVVYGSFASHADMRTVAPVFGSAEGVLMEVAAGQLAKRYKLPHRGMGLVTTSHTSDAQAAWEKMNCLWSLTLSNVHMLLQAAGWLEGGLTASYEQFILDLDMLESMESFLAGFPIDEDSLALDIIAKVGPGGNFLLTDHTLSHFRMTARFSPLMDSRRYDTWQGDNASTLLTRASAIWKKMLAEYEEPPLDPGLAEALGEFVERRKRGEPLSRLVR